MPLDPSTLVARTATGDAELAAPRHGLAIAQRRLLSLLDRASPLDELSGRPGVLPDRLEKDLGRLAELGLVALHAPSTPSAAPSRPPAKPAAPPAAPKVETQRPWLPAQPGLAATVTPPPPESRVILGKRVRRGRAILLGFLTLCAVGGAAWWLSAPAPTPGRSALAPPPAAAIAPAPVPAPAAPRVSDAQTAVPEPVRVVAAPESFVTLPVASAAPATPPVAEARRPSTSTSAPPATRLEVPATPPAAPRLPAVPVATTIAPPGAAPAESTAVALPASVPAAPVTVPAAVPAIAQVPAPAPPTPPATTPAPAASPPAPTAAAPTPPVQLAAAAPSTLPARPAPRRLEPVTREAPVFPRDALAIGIAKGTVRARLSIDAAGKVTGVEILESQPRRVFDRSVSRALARWTYEPGEASRTTEVEIAFNRD